MRPPRRQCTRLLCPWEFPREEYWSGLPFPPPKDLPDPGIKPESPVSPALAGRFFTVGPPRKPEDPLRSCQFSLTIVGAGGSACRSSPESATLWSWVSWRSSCPKNRACGPGRGLLCTPEERAPRGINSQRPGVHQEEDTAVFPLFAGWSYLPCIK